MTRFHWVRHGPTNLDGLIGWTDAPADLSDADAVARLDAALPGDALVVSSDLIRSVATADAICGARERLDHDPDLREFHFGEWEALTGAEVSRSHPELARAYWSDPGDAAPPGGESWNTAAARVAGAVDRLIATHPGRDIVVVAHFGVILTQLQRASRMTPLAAFSFKIDNLSLTRMEHLDPHWRVLGVNHLP